MAHRPAAFVAIAGLLMTLTQAPASAAVGAPAPTPMPAAPMATELFQLKGSVPVDSVTPAPRTVNLQQLESDGRYRTLRSVTSTPEGAFEIPARITKPTRFRVTSNGVGSLDAVVSTSRRVEVASQSVWATAKRVCDTSNNCGDTAEVSGLSGQSARIASFGCRCGRPAAGSTSLGLRTARTAAEPSP